MQYMATLPDNSFDLAIVDPPYGIGRSGHQQKSCKSGGRRSYEFKGWDDDIPKDLYFNDLKRISKNQIIWGANYFVKYLSGSMGWIVWHKNRGDFSSSDCELAFTSFQRALRLFEYNPILMLQEGGMIHPTQKPIQLYKWLLKNYAKEGDKIIDTHLGSGSSAIAAHEMHFDFVGCEIDQEYYDAAVKRYNLITSQLKLF